MLMTNTFSYYIIKLLSKFVFLDLCPTSTSSLCSRWKLIKKFLNGQAQRISTGHIQMNGQPFMNISTLRHRGHCTEQRQKEYNIRRSRNLEPNSFFWARKNYSYIHKRQRTHIITRQSTF